MDPVSALNLAAQQGYRPAAAEEMPIAYRLQPRTDELFAFVAEVCGRAFQGSPARNKKEAKRLAALAAIMALREESPDRECAPQTAQPIDAVAHMELCDVTAPTAADSEADVEHRAPVTPETAT